MKQRRRLPGYPDINVIFKVHLRIFMCMYGHEDRWLKKGLKKAVRGEGEERWRMFV